MFVKSLLLSAMFVSSSVYADSIFDPPRHRPSPSRSCVDKALLCVEEFMSDLDTMSCIRSRANAEIVRACTDAFFMDSDAVQCVTLARSVRLIEACDRNHVSDRAALFCLKSESR